TNGAEIIAMVEERDMDTGEENIVIRAGAGVGTVTKAGLSIPVGEPAINPIPRQMIRESMSEVLQKLNIEMPLLVTISVHDGKQLAEKTLNQRLGIVGGLSILGTTGIVRPVSAKAWTDTIDASMRVARAAGLEQVVLSTGRTSEAAVEKIVHLPEEALVMMGDYLFYALTAAQSHGFDQIYLAGMWAKILKCALGIPQTHVRHGVLEVGQAVGLLLELGLDKKNADTLLTANTAREILLHLRKQSRDDLIRAVCIRARQYAEQCSGLPVNIYLVTSEDGVLEHV
ncbi:MAG: cobalamin biosynthesis protein CbiD, partial [Candidatus Electrothrix sp. AR3]|nr:cobalamin biosynthesis protein CbiD [Candidatus Electrothrix sp. AR3]